VLVRVDAAGVNFIDIYQRSGQYKTALPIPLGLEGAGVVEAVGPGVEQINPGDRVAWARGPGSYATHVAIAVEQLILIPNGLETLTVAASMLQGMTAHYLARSTYPLYPGDTCLIHAAAGGVGLLLCQMARRSGARVIGTVSTKEKSYRARDAGANHVIISTEADFAEETRKLTNGEGVSVVYDSIGKDTFDRSLGCLKRRGMLVLYGQSSGPVPPFDPQILAKNGSLMLTRPALHDYTATRRELEMRAGEVLGWVRDGTLQISIGATFPLSKAAEAHKALAGRETIGKVLLTPG
jgi:NADPH2:quinone reductase